MPPRRHKLRPSTFRLVDQHERKQNRILEAINRVVRAVWHQIVGILSSPRAELPVFVKTALAALPGSLTKAIGQSLVGLHAFVHNSTAKSIFTILPASARSKLAQQIPPTERLTPKQMIGVVFPPPPVAKVEAIVYRGNWQSRIQTITKLADPEIISNRVAQSFYQGKTG